MVDIQPVTVREAQFLIDMSEKEINRAIDRGEVERVSDPAETRHTLRLRRPARKIGMSELLFLALEKQMHADLTPAGRKKLYLAFKRKSAKQQTIEFGLFKVSLTDIQKGFIDRYKQLHDAKKEIMEQDGSDPVIKGTDISAYRIAALTQGQALEHILADYPTLSKDQVQAAIAYAAAYPKAGRPYPSRSFRRAADSLADMGVFDVIETGSDA